MTPLDRVVIVGVGLLGGSIGLAMRKRKLARRVVGYGRSAETLEESLRLQAVDAVETDLEAACRDADLVVICTPVQLVGAFVRDCIPFIARGGWVTDVGSTKLRICDSLSPAGRDSFCGSHPLAGSDKSGVSFARPDLFENRLTIVTPTETTPAGLAERTEQFWQALGSRTARMSPEEHDRGVACTSHLPHVVAAALAAATPDELLPLVATGWCDTTRVAGGSVELWRQILAENRQPVLNALENFALSLEPWMTALREADGEQLTKLLSAGKQQRDAAAE